MDMCPRDIADLPFCPVDKTYVRFDQGMTVMPWLLSAILLSIHLPIVWLRVMQWESAQILSLAITAFDVVLVMVAFGSTKLASMYVCTWAPITLTLDVGAVLQIFVLICAQPGSKENMKITIVGWLNSINLFQRNGKERCVDPNSGEEDEECLSDDDISNVRHSANLGACSMPANPPAALFIEHTNEAPWDAIESLGPESAAEQAHNRLVEQHTQSYQPNRRNPCTKSNGRSVEVQTALLVLCVLLFLALISLQITGLVFSAKGNAENESLAMSFASPGLQLGSILFDSNCNAYNLTKDEGQGVRKFLVPGGTQHGWLHANVIVLSIELVLEAVDAVIMFSIFMDRGRRLQRRRPWFTMVSGIAAWAVIIGFGVYFSQKIPFEENRVALAGDDLNSTCQVLLYPAGLRGTMIAWADGLFYGYNATVYYGPIGNNI